MKPEKMLVTCALPYANGSLHLGHMLEHIQADVWVRFHRMLGNEIYFVCADDAHGTPIMLNASKQGISPEEMIAKVQKEHQTDFEGFHISFDNYHSTHSKENLELTTQIYNSLNQKGFIKRKIIKQLFDPEKQMFLPDRFVKGNCPKCKASDQYGDNCEVCSATYEQIDLLEPKSVLSNATPVIKDSEHLFFDLPHFSQMLEKWICSDALQNEISNKLKDWFKAGLQQWNISRDAPYFGFQIPGEKDKYFYVWLDAPVGYIASFANMCAKKGLDYQEFWKKDSKAKLYHFIGKDIVYFHSLFWPAMLQGADLRQPTGIFTHGYVTVDGVKMSKSRGTFIQAQTYLKHLDAECLRYYYCTKLNDKVEDIDLNLEDFIQKVNSDLVNKLVNLASRTAGFITKQFDNKLASKIDNIEILQPFLEIKPIIAELYNKRQFSRAMRLVMELCDQANKFIDEAKPWVFAKDIEKANELQQICTLGLEMFRILMSYLKPVLPNLAKRSEDLLNTEFTWQNIENLLINHKIKSFTPLFKRIEAKQIEAMINETKEIFAPQEKEKPQTDFIKIDDFAKLDLRVAKVISCEAVPESNKLLKFNLDLGDHQRIIFSGIKSAYPEPDKLAGRMVVIVANLAPRKMRFGVSEGMILSAGDDPDKIFLLDVDSGATAGMKIS